MIFTRKPLVCIASVFTVTMFVLSPLFLYAATKPDIINITYVRLPFNVPAVIAKRLGLFEKEFGTDRITVQRPEMNTGSQQMQALAAGSVQFASVAGAETAILARSNGVDLKVIAAFSRAPRAFTIMVKNAAIRNPGDLKGKIVVGPKGTVSHHLLIAALKREGLSVNAIKFVNMTVPQALAALLAGSADAALIVGSAIMSAESAGARVLLDGEGLVSGLTVTIVSGVFLKEHPDFVMRYLKVQDQALQYMKKNPAEMIKMVSAEMQISETSVRRMLPWYDFNPQITPKDIADLIATQSFLKENDLLTDAVDVHEMIRSGLR